MPLCGGKHLACWWLWTDRLWDWPPVQAMVLKHFASSQELHTSCCYGFRPGTLVLSGPLNANSQYEAGLASPTCDKKLKSLNGMQLGQGLEFANV